MTFCRWAVVLSLLLAACAADGQQTVKVEREVPFTTTLTLDIHHPTGAGPWPTVVLFHGGGWIGGEPDNIAPLAREIASGGAVVFNATYRTMGAAGGGYPQTFEDAACAIRLAGASTARYGGDPKWMVVAGHSAGAHIAVVVALAGDSFSADACAESTWTAPTAFVGVAGPFNVVSLEEFLAPFFGGSTSAAPEAWASGDPYRLLGTASVDIFLVHGDEDRLVDLSSSEAFATAAEAAAHTAEVVVIAQASHSSVINPLGDGSATVDVILRAAGS